MKDRARYKNGKSAWCPERPRELKTHSLGIVAVRTMSLLNLPYIDDQVQVATFDQLTPGSLYSIVKGSPRECNYHSFIALSNTPLTVCYEAIRYT